MVGNFSNDGIDTFDPDKQYIGIRLQQGVPLLDRDWNELEDIRRHYERTLRRSYIGTGAPDADGWTVGAAEADDDVVIGRGRALVAGFDVANPGDVLFSEQGERVTVPGARAGRATDVVELWLVVSQQRIDGTVDADLLNRQDVNIETCVRDRLEWEVVAVVEGDPHDGDAMLLARITRRPGVRRIPAADIRDARRTDLNLATTMDRLLALGDRIDALDDRLEQVQETIDSWETWEMSVTASPASLDMLGTTTLTVTLRQRNGVPVRGARLAVSSSWGVLSTTTSSTGQDGTATIMLTGSYPEVPLRPGDLGVLRNVTRKVDLARSTDRQTIQFESIALEPAELAVMSRYTPPSDLIELATDVPLVFGNSPPTYARTATVKVDATESGGSVVRATGSVQVTFGQWVRDWVLTKLRDVQVSVQVEARIADALRRNLSEQTQSLDVDTVARRELPLVYQAVADTTNVALKSTLFDNPELDDEELHGSGAIAQVIAQEATAAIGAAANRAIDSQVALFRDDPTIPEFDGARAAEARFQLTQTSAQLTAGLTQSHRQLFGLPRRGV